MQGALLAEIELGGDEIWFDEPWELEPVRPAARPVAMPVQPPAQEQKQGIAQFADSPVLAQPAVQLQDYASAQDLETLYQMMAGGTPYVQNPNVPLIHSQGPHGAPVFIFGMAPSLADLKAQQLFGGAEGELLDNMLTKVLGLNRSQNVLGYLQKSLFRKRLLPRERTPLRLAFEREIRLFQPQALLCLGAHAAWELLQNGSPLEQMQAQELYFAGVPLFVTYSLEEMLLEPSTRRNAMLALNRTKAFLQSQSNTAKV